MVVCVWGGGGGGGTFRLWSVQLLFMASPFLTSIVLLVYMQGKHCILV